MTGDAQGFTLHYAIRLPNGELFTAYNGEVARWSEQRYAENVLRQLAEQATAMGITEYLGQIVRSYATPFIGPNDGGEQLVDELQAWLRRETGGKS
jgi:hypothetical protein